MPDNVVAHHGFVAKQQRRTMLKQKGTLLWLTGLPGSGKSTIAYALEKFLTATKKLCYVLDGDNIRLGLNSNLGFSLDDRRENIRRIGEVGALFCDTGVITIASFVSPSEQDRKRVRDIFDNGDFIEIYLNTPLEVCEERDPKGHYAKARSGEIKNFTGISSKYDIPKDPEIKINTHNTTIDENVQIIVENLVKNGRLDP
ncbi:MAG: adenylyl-sulfate kinase [Candidatus Latescibacterota bacterium]|nr:adenylyl-sulfate kinase [Candidatus Latescibacterota bacterium]